MIQAGVHGAAGPAPPGDAVGRPLHLVLSHRRAAVAAHRRDPEHADGVVAEGNRPHVQGLAGHVVRHGPGLGHIRPEAAAELVGCPDAEILARVGLQPAVVVGHVVEARLWLHVAPGAAPAVGLLQGVAGEGRAVVLRLHPVQQDLRAAGRRGRQRHLLRRARRGRGLAHAPGHGAGLGKGLALPVLLVDGMDPVVARLAQGDAGVGVAGAANPPLQHPPGCAAVFRDLDAVSRRPGLWGPGQADTGGGLAGPHGHAGAAPRGDGGRVVAGVVVVHRRGVPAGVGHGLTGSFRGVRQIPWIVLGANADLVVPRAGDAYGGSLSGRRAQDQYWLRHAARPIVAPDPQFTDVPHAGGVVVTALADVEHLRAGGQPSNPRCGSVVGRVVDGDYSERVPVGSNGRTGPAVFHRQVRYRSDDENVGFGGTEGVVAGCGVSVAVFVAVCGGASKLYSVVQLIGAKFLKLGEVFKWIRCG